MAMLGKGMEIMAKQLLTLIPPEVFETFKSVLSNIGAKADSMEKSMQEIKAQNARILSLLDSNKRATNDTIDTPTANVNGRISERDARGVIAIPETNGAETGQLDRRAYHP